MKEQIEKRIEQLKAEYDMGTKKLEELERQTFEIRQTMLRISGAITVLEEVLKENIE